jgi:hypothetical protein
LEIVNCKQRFPFNSLLAFEKDLDVNESLNYS